MTKSKKQWTFWVIIGGISAALSYVLLNKNTREKTVTYVKEGAQFVDETSRFVKDNQEEIRTLIRETTDKVNALVNVASRDVEEIAKHTSHLKTTATDFIDTAKTAANELKHQKQVEETPLDLPTETGEKKNV
ncbi:hypothetical protein ACE1TF_11530 [Geomicrobium sp. JSM 1781026]|uniref:hypothetical protein n=1 Tax=Geomicrobium sp. JSM 1781026 TaxID=3344580 RepID=UPI0035C05F54